MTEDIKDLSVTEEILEVEEVDEVLQEMLANYNPDNFPLANSTYKLVKNYREGFDYEALIKRYNTILEKYDYIVGDWGYDQLRLKGFFIDDFKGAPLDAKISTLEDYIYEYCNFGCAYFVIQQTGDFKRKGRSTQTPTKRKNPNNKNSTNSKSKNKAHTDEKKFNPNKKNKKPKLNGKNTSSTQVAEKKGTPASKHQFTIRKKEVE